MNQRALRVLLVPDSVHWVTGTIAKNIARFNPWIEATVASGPAIDAIFAERPELMRNFDLVHFTCPYSSKQWLPRFRDLVPCVTSHHHVTDWDAIKHNVESDAIIVGSPEWAEDLQARGADISRVFCVPYGVDANLFQPATAEQRRTVRQKLKLEDSATVIGFFGKNSSNDDDRKGIDVFTKAILSLKERLPQLAVLIVGPGWQALTNELNSAGVKCIWIPFVAELSGLSELYRALDFYWVTARVEGGPVTLLEAMSTEVSCLTTPVGIAREIVRDGENALLLPFNDTEAFANRTLELWRNTEERKRLGRNARATILKEMHVGITSPGVRPVYERAFENFAKRRQLSVPVDINAIAKGFAPARELDASVIDSVPLAGFPVSLHRRIKMLETLAWSEHLILYHRQRAVAARMILKEWFRNPVSPLPLRVLLRRFLPVPFVARLVRIKNRSQVSPRFVTTYPPTNKA
jgi:glycosyltransferase involved in cell wall biosynthesis